MAHFRVTPAHQGRVLANGRSNLLAFRGCIPKRQTGDIAGGSYAKQDRERHRPRVLVRPGLAPGRSGRSGHPEALRDGHVLRGRVCSA